MSTISNLLPILWKALLIVLLIALFSPLIYVAVYKPADYFLCRGFVSMKVGKGFSPNALDDYVLETLMPGMTKDEVIGTLEEIGRVKVHYLGDRAYQLNVQICTDPFNRIIVFARYGDGGRLLSIQIADD